MPSDHSGTLHAHHQDADDNEYATPPKIWRPLARAVGGFDLDPASGAEDVPIADERYTAADDGLRQPWHGWVFCNPPWSSSGDGSTKERWLSKARHEVERDAVDGVVVLLPTDTSAYWFHDHLLAADVICFVGPGRVAFVGEDRNPSFELVIGVFGAIPQPLVDTLSRLGATVIGRAVHTTHEQTRLEDDPR